LRLPRTAPLSGAGARLPLGVPLGCVINVHFFDFEMVVGTVTGLGCRVPILIQRKV
jgi:hypothetical protein